MQLVKNALNSEIIEHIYYWDMKTDQNARLHVIIAFSDNAVL